MSGMPSTTTDLTLQHPRKPSMPANRSNPLSLTPPKGSDCAMYVAQKSFTVVMPAEPRAHLQRATAGPEHVRSQAEIAVVRQTHSLLIARDLHHREHGPEHLFLHDAHVVGDVDDDGGWVKLPGGGRLSNVAPDEHARTLRHGVIDEALHVLRLLRHAHCAAVHVLGQSPSLAELRRRLEHLGDESIVDLLVHVESLGARAVLPAALERAAERHGHALSQIRVLEDDERVLAAEFEHDRGERLRRGFHDETTDAGGSDKDNLPAPAGDERVTSLAVPVHDLHEVARRAHRVEARLDRAAVIQRAPAGVLGHFHHEGVTGEEVGEERVEDVVEGVVPGDDGAHDAHGVVLDAGGLVEHHQTRGALLGLEPTLAVAEKPLDLLEGDEDLAEGGVDERLAAVARGDAADVILIVEDESGDHLEEEATLGERRLGPLLLGDARAFDLGANLVGGHRGHVGAEHLEVARVVARDAILGELGAGDPLLTGDALALGGGERDGNAGHAAREERDEGEVRGGARGGRHRERRGVLRAEERGEIHRAGQELAEDIHHLGRDEVRQGRAGRRCDGLRHLERAKRGSARRRRGMVVERRARVGVVASGAIGSHGIQVAIPTLSAPSGKDFCVDAQILDRADSPSPARPRAPPGVRRTGRPRP